MRLAVIIPVYNERSLIEKAVARLDAVPPPGRLDRRLFLVDDGSTDGTADIVRRLGERADITAVLHPANAGKGAAIRTGLSAALKAGADLAIIHDADLEYDPADHEAILRPILDGRADAVIGSRFLGQTHRVLYYWHRIANQVITQFSNMMTNLNLTDIECCLKAFAGPVLAQLRIQEDRFGLEPEIVARLARMRLHDPDNPGRTRPLRIYEAPVSYAGRTYAEGKKIRWTDGLSALRCILKYNLFS
ncbi:MAG: glycosyltransferase family 2 protein [Phycisphaerales bacterium]|nr:glycosyltransferase family 2 protein [Phycisphaerales bacterium]